MIVEQRLEGGEGFSHGGWGGPGELGALQVEETASAKALSAAEKQVSWRLEWWAVSEGSLGSDGTCTSL